MVDADGLIMIVKKLFRYACAFFTSHFTMTVFISPCISIFYELNWFSGFDVVPEEAPKDDHFHDEIDNYSSRWVSINKILIDG